LNRDSTKYGISQRGIDYGWGKTIFIHISTGPTTNTIYYSININGETILLELTLIILYNLFKNIAGPSCPVYKLEMGKLTYFANLGTRFITKGDSTWI
jgi:hypothetical protein